MNFFLERKKGERIIKTHSPFQHKKNPQKKSRDREEKDGTFSGVQGNTQNIPKIATAGLKL